MESHERTGPGTARHLRRRRFWQTSASEGFPAQPRETAVMPVVPPEHKPASIEESQNPPAAPPRRAVGRQQFKRIIALTVVIITCLAIVALVAALIFWS